MARGTFLTRLAIYELEGWGGGEWFCLLEPLVYRDEDGREYEAPAASLTNFGNVPRWFWFFIPRSGKHTKATVIHDVLCDTEGGRWKLPSGEVHAVFRRALRACSCWVTTIWVMWAGVRAFGPRFSGGD